MSHFTFSAKPSSILIAGKVDLLSSTFQPLLVFSITTSGGSILKSSSEKVIAGFGFKLFIVFTYSDNFSSLTFASLQSFWISPLAKYSRLFVTISILSLNKPFSFNCNLKHSLNFLRIPQ